MMMYTVIVRHGPRDDVSMQYMNHKFFKKRIEKHSFLTLPLLQMMFMQTLFTKWFTTFSIAMFHALLGFNCVLVLNIKSWS